MSRRGKGGGGDRRQQTSSPTEFDEDDMSSMDDMRRYIRMLENQLTDLQDAQQQTQSRGGGGRAKRVSMTETHNVEDERDMYQRVILLENDLSAEKAKTLEMLDQIAILESKLKKEMEEKGDILGEKAALQKKYDETKKFALEEKMRAEAASRVGAEAAQKGRAETSEMVKLYEDNKRLAEENEMLAERVEEMRVEGAELMEAVEAMQELLTVKENEKEDALTEIGRLTKQLAGAKKELEETQAQLLFAHETETRYEQQMAKLRHDHAVEEAKLKVEVEERKRDLEKAKRQVDALHTDTAAGEKAREVEVLEGLLGEERQVAEMLQAKLEEAQESMMKLEAVVGELSQSAENREYHMVLEEKKKTKEMELAVASLKAQVAEDAARYAELEKEKTSLQVDLQTAHNWMAMYEEKYDLTKAVAYSKVLQEDIKRRDAEIEKMSLENGELMDEREFLLETCARLKQQAGLSDDFWFSDLEIKESLASERERMKGVMQEMERQMGEMEAERLRLLKTLREQAGQVSEKGIKFAGLNADQMLQVNEFAKNLREGRVTLPLNDKSKELAAEVKKLKDQSVADRMLIARLEGERAGNMLLSPAVSPSAKDGERRGSEGGAGGHHGSRALSELKEELKGVRGENKELKAQLEAIKDELHKGHSRDKASAVDLARFEEAMEQVKELNHEVKELEHRNAELKGKLVAAESIAMGLADQMDHSHMAEQLGEVQRTVADIASTQQLLQAQLKDQGGRGKGPSRSQVSALTGRREGVDGGVQGPRTDYGRELLSKLLIQLNLPPEEWADDVKELSAQLVSTLEELSAREKELEEHDELLRRYEGHLTLMRQQVATLYKEHLAYSCKAQETEERMKKENGELRDQRTSLQIKVQRLEELVALQETCEQHPTELHAAAKDMARRIMAFEVNEATLAKKYTILQEQLKGEAAARARLEQDLVDAEGACKRRIAWLEEWKAGAVHRLESLEAQLEASVSKREYELLAKELELLRDDYLDLLQREAEARIELLRRKEEPEVLKRAEDRIVELEVNVSKLEANIRTLTGEVEHQMRLTDLAMADLAATVAETGETGMGLVHEVAKFRGEAARVEVELSAAKKRGALLAQKLADSEAKVKSLEQRVKGLEVKEANATKDAQQAKKEALEVETKYGKGGGLTASEAEGLRKERKALLEERAALQRELERFKDMADIASGQVQALSLLRRDKDEAIEELRRHCAELESRSDDDTIIGRLQRMLMSTKASYKAFARKHEIARVNLRKKEAMNRALEVRLDEREEALHRTHHQSRQQVAVLRKALQQLAMLGLGGEDHSNTSSSQAGAREVSLFERAKALSDRILELAKLAENREKEMKVGEVAIKRMRETVEGLQTEKQALLEQCQDLKLAVRAKAETGPAIERELGRRLLALSEDLKATKLTLLQTRRQGNALRDEKRNLELALVKQQDVLSLMEEDRVDKETAKYHPLHHATGAGAGGGGHVGLLDLIFQPYEDSSPFAQSERRRAEGGMGEQMVPEVEAVMRDLEATQNEVMELSTQAAAMKQEKQLLLARLDSVIMSLQEYQNAVRFYENQAAQEKLPTFPINSAAASVVIEPGEGQAGRQAGAAGSNREDETQLQEAANATIGSLKRLIEEKNRIIDRYERKLAEARLLSRKESAVNKAEIDRLTEKLFRKNEDAISQLKHAVIALSKTELTESGAHLSKRLMEQVEDATSIISEKDETIRQLELKLRTANNQRERAESRCGAALEEQERMRSDMVMLAKQLQDAEERVLEAIKGKGPDKGTTQVAELRAALASKENKMRGLRSAIVRLKEEFIRAEEAHARKREEVDAEKENRHHAHKSEMTDQVKALREQVEMLQSGFAQAKADIEAARKQKDKSAKARAALEEENERLSARIVELETSARRLEEDTNRMRGELNEARRMEQRAKDRLKDHRSEGKDHHGEGGGSRVEDLEKKVKVLTAQNAALRATLDTMPQGAGTKARLAESEAASVAGASLASPSNNKDAKKNAWETEKRLRRRVEVLEKRLEEKAHELQAAEGQANQAKELLSRSVKEKESLQKRLAALLKDSTQAKDAVLGEVKRSDVDKTRIFELEEEVARLRRKADLEQAQKIITLTTQLDAAEDRVKELEASLESAEKERREALSGRRAGGHLQEAEASYLREEALREQVSELKRERREAEARMLKKDTDAMDLRFDLEERNLEVARLKRRVGELEAANRMKEAAGGNEAAKATDEDRKAGGRFKRERDLEGVVEALKRVVEKLRAENERLRRGAGGEQGRQSESEKKLKEFKTKLADAQEEIARLKGRASSGEEASLKLAQKTETVNQLRKQLRVKDEAIRSWQQRCESLESERDSVQRDLDRVNLRVIALEKEMIGLRAGGSSRRGSVTAAERDEVDRLRHEVSEQREVIDALRAAASSSGGGGKGGKGLAARERRELEEEIARLKDQVKASGHRGAVGQRGLVEENRRLKEENAKLNQELQAFDLDFFEEIEDLKFKYQQATNSLKASERRMEEVEWRAKEAERKLEMAQGVTGR